MKYFVAILTFIVVFSFFMGMSLLHHYVGHGGFEAGEALAKAVFAGNYLGACVGGLVSFAVINFWPSKK